MKKNLIIITMMLSMMLIFSACGGTTDSPSLATDYDPYVGGSNALTIEFMPGMIDIPGSILDNGNEFSVGIKIVNDGEHDINAESESDYFNLELLLNEEQYGVSENDLKTNLEEDLKGKQKNVGGTTLPGDSTILSFDELKYQPDIQGELIANFVVDACYDYSTKTSTRVCIAEDVNDALIDERSKQICEIVSPQETQNSAGPVKVQNFQQYNAGSNKIAFTFEVLTAGNGNIYSYENDNNCEKQTDKDKVKVIVSLPEQNTKATLSCSGFEDDGEGLENTLFVQKNIPYIVTCKITAQEGGDNIYLETLNIDLYYRYNEQISKEVVIRDAGNEE